jgi:EAL domain-containing protein (putative c-di-GMP-specific phosphodiesterase class I)
MQQPIASLLGEDKGMFDVLVRMIDEQGQELLPAEFMAAAERNDLMKHIDRWIIGAAMSFCASRPVKQLFVRLSKDSVRDKSLLQWLSNQLKATRIDANRIAFQVSEQVAAEYLADTTELANGLRKAGFLFALEHFGTGRDPKRLLAHLPVNYIKVDGTLMQGLSVDQNLQQRVREFVDQAKSKQVGTIAERVQDANTMAVLWQLGIEFIQGYFVNEPEEVVMG